MDAIAGAVAGFLKPGKAKLVQDPGKAGGGAGGGGLGALASAAASMLPIPGLGAKDKPTELTFMFNPEKYTISQHVEVNRQPAQWKPGGTVQYLSTGPLILTVELFLNDFASLKGDVTPQVTKLLDWQKPPKGKEEPPKLVMFEWGNTQFKTFKGVIVDLNCTYTVFRKDGTPVEARVNLTIEDAGELKAGKNPTSHAVEMRRVRVVTEGESLASVANDELGDPGYWRAIASLNEIDDPLRVRPGRSLFIPSVTDAADMA